MENALDRRHTGMVLAVMFFAMFMDGIDGSIVNVALPTIGKSFGIDTATVSWVTITYLMMVAGSLVAFARVAENTGVRNIMALGFAIFTVASLMCGVSASFAFLIVSRLIQGVGAAMIAAGAPMCCVKHLPPEKLAFGLGITTIGSSVGYALGPFIGGVLVGLVSWHWIFLINLPIGIVSVLLILKAVPARKDEVRKKLDLPGTVVLFAAIVLMTFAVEALSYSGLRTIAIASMVLGILLLVLFVRIERKDEPLLKLSMFRRWDFSAIFICLFLMNTVTMVSYLVPFYGEICMHLDSVTVGFYLLVSAGVTAVLGIPFSKLSDRYGRKPFCAVSGLFYALSFLLYFLFAKDLSEVVLLVNMVLAGVAWACVGGPMSSRLVEHAGDEASMASSLTNEGFYVGGAVGTALVAMLFTMFSGTDGIDISMVSPDQFLTGMELTCLVLFILALAISVMSAIVKDDD